MWQPIALGGTYIETADSFKLLEVYISADFTLSTHCEFILKKAYRRFYVLRKLKGCGVEERDFVDVYCSLVSSIVEYGAVVFAHMPQYLLSALERI